jgi:hypothetical protein
LKLDRPWTIPSIIKNAKCPKCKTHLGNKIKSIIYYNCRWSIYGQVKTKEGEEEEDEFEIHDTTGLLDYSVGLPNDNEPVEFEHLTFQCKKWRSKHKKAKKDDSDDE